jgi:putative ABC transport system ATP-binding protein
MSQAITADPIIQIAQLNHYYGSGGLRRKTLCDINLSINSGEIVILTGPSGSGKTTLLTLIGALRATQEGSLRILGQELHRASPRTLTQIRRKIGFIFQGYNLLPFMTAQQNVRMAMEVGASPVGDRRPAAVKRLLTAVGLGDQLHHHPDQLSGGQKQRVAIARALINEPSLILADEPTAALDRHTGREIVQLMQQLARDKQCTILLVTHDHRILDIADRIINLEDGQITANPASNN